MGHGLVIMMVQDIALVVKIGAEMTAQNRNQIYARDTVLGMIITVTVRAVKVMVAVIVPKQWHKFVTDGQIIGTIVQMVQGIVLVNPVTVEMIVQKQRQI